MLNLLIMAGGKGTRFWPMSTNDKPKQFLSLVDKKTMIQATVDRLKPLVSIDHIFICTGKQYAPLVMEQLPDLPKRNIIIEPVGRNTAPCILLSSLYIKQVYGKSNIVVLPSDHKITNENKFLSVLASADAFLNVYNKSIITIGITPDRPETGYGYINYGQDIGIINNNNIKKVNKFVEKPDIETAKRYIKDGHYLWNAGMFVFDADFMIGEFSKYYGSYEKLSSLPLIDDGNYDDELKKIYEQCESISVDYAIMERSDNIYVIPSNFGWDDIGSWKALERYIPKDDDDNIFKGNVRSFDSRNNIIYGQDKEIILLDIDDIFCIDTNERIVIGKKDSLTKVHELRGQ